MTVKLLYFAWVREKTGIAEENVELPEEVRTVAQLLAWQRARGPQFADAFDAEARVLTALNQCLTCPLMSGN